MSGAETARGNVMVSAWPRTCRAAVCHDSPVFSMRARTIFLKFVGMIVFSGRAAAPPC
jgi:hypothetical protein